MFSSFTACLSAHSCRLCGRRQSHLPSLPHPLRSSAQREPPRRRQVHGGAAPRTKQMWNSLIYSRPHQVSTFCYIFFAKGSMPSPAVCSKSQSYNRIFLETNRNWGLIRGDAAPQRVSQRDEKRGCVEEIGQKERGRPRNWQPFHYKHQALSMLYTRHIRHNCHRNQCFPFCWMAITRFLKLWPTSWAWTLSRCLRHSILHFSYSVNTWKTIELNANSTVYGKAWYRS